MRTASMIRALSLLCFLPLSIISCGSDSGSGANGNQQIEVITPQNETRVSAGEMIRYELSLSNFRLAAPIDRRTLRHDSEDASTESGDTVTQDPDHGDGSSTVHDESSPEVPAHEEVDSHHSEDSSAHDEDEGLPHTHDDETSHTHSDDAINPGAREGHYHIYWDEATGTDPHVTAWSYSGEFQIPHDASAGMHTLRFELRDNNHTIIGTPGSEVIVFLEVR